MTISLEDLEGTDTLSGYLEPEAGFTEIALGTTVLQRRTSFFKRFLVLTTLLSTDKHRISGKLINGDDTVYKWSEIIHSGSFSIP